MTQDQARLFYEVVHTPWRIDAITALAEESKQQLMVELVSRVEAQDWHVASVIVGQIRTWEALRKRMIDEAGKYKAPRTESAV